MKHTKHILLMAAMLMSSLSVSAEVVQIDGIWYDIVKKAKQAEVVANPDGTKYSGAIIIPTTVTYDNVGYSVISIASAAFYKCSSLTSITIPEGVTSIGTFAFYYCSSLISITIPESMTEIRDFAFYDCSNLATVHISSLEAWCKISFRSNPLPYARNLYLNGELVKNLVIPEGVTSIANSAFEGCSCFTTVTIPESVTSIGGRAFADCNLTAITLPESVTSIGDGAFYDCSLTAVYISSLEAWCKISFSEGSSNPLAYAQNLYLNGQLATELVIPESVTSIGDFAFCYCNSLTAITIPESVTSIGIAAFNNCSGLKTIVLPKSIESIGSFAFANCSELLNVYCYAESVPFASSDALEGSYSEYATLHIPESAIENYKGTAPWNNFGTIVSLDVAITRITLSETAVTLTEGETASLTITTTPEDVDRNLISWSSNNSYIATVDNTGTITAIAPGIATITVTANDGSGVNASCEVEVKEKLLDKCAAPVIDYIDGQVVLTCETEGVTFKSSITADDARSYDEAIYAFTGIYTITAQATKEGYLDSEAVTATLCWVPCDENHGGETTDIITIPAKPVLIQTDGGTITVNGLSEGTVVKVNDLNGVELGTATATGGIATITTSLTAGSVAIVKIGGYSAKVAIK